MGCAGEIPSGVELPAVPVASIAANVALARRFQIVLHAQALVRGGLTDVHQLADRLNRTARGLLPIACIYAIALQAIRTRGRP